MAVLVILVVLALLFGVGAVLEGLAWAFLITLVLLAVAAWWGFTKVRGMTSRR
jgi:TRAP-type C4-dicarboxylate transport system permease large subunit